MTTDLEAVRTAINGIGLAGGGDTPESVYDAIVFGMDPDNFTFVNPIRFALVIGDAPPQSPGDACYEATFNEAVAAPRRPCGREPVPDHRTDRLATRGCGHRKEAGNQGPRCRQLLAAPGLS